MNDSDEKEQVEATEVRSEVDRLREQGYDAYISQYSDAIETAMEQVIEEGTFTPDCKISAGLNLTLRERLSGTREQDMTAVFLTGLMLGSALERDIPQDSEIEEKWREGEVRLP